MCYSNSKKQATSETTTYGSEFLASQTCIEQIIDLQNSFCYLCVPICNTSYLWVDNKSQVKSLTFAYAKLNERHNILSFHFICNMVLQGFLLILRIFHLNIVWRIFYQNIGVIKLLMRIFSSHYFTTMAMVTNIQP